MKTHFQLIFCQQINNHLRNGLLLHRSNFLKGLAQIFRIGILQMRDYPGSPIPDYQGISLLNILSYLFSLFRICQPLHNSRRSSVLDPSRQQNHHISTASQIRIIFKGYLRTILFAYVKWIQYLFYMANRRRIFGSMVKHVHPHTGCRCHTDHLLNRIKIRSDSIQSEMDTKNSVKLFYHLAQLDQLFCVAVSSRIITKSYRKSYRSLLKCLTQLFLCHRKRPSF